MAAPLGGGMPGFPEELRHALNGYAGRADGILAAIDILPRTLCQGDVHHDNLILREEADGVQVYLKYIFRQAVSAGERLPRRNFVTRPMTRPFLLI